MARTRTLTRFFAAAIVALSTMLAPLHAQETVSAKKPGVAAMLSIVLPGLGQSYAGGKVASRFFFFTEASFWSGLVLFKHLESSRGKNYEAFAAAHAGLDTEGKPNSYFDEVGIFSSLFARNQYEQFIEGETANLRPETSENVWEWDSEASRLTFRDLRRKAASARQKSLLFVGALLFNRFTSALNAAHIARKTRPSEPAVGMSVIPQPSGGAFAIVHARF